MQQATIERFRLALLLHALALALVLLWWLDRGRPVSLAEPSLANQALPCLSYAPFRRPGVNPLDPDGTQAVVSPAQIEEDLRIIGTQSNCIRTYGVAQGLDAVPAIAARLGMRVKLGAWLGRDAQRNRAELERALALAHEFKGTVDLLIIGNEVLLRGEMPPAELAKTLAWARQRSPVPVTYADVWEFWLRHAWLAAHVDVVTVHILPYWEDDPVAVGDAVAHVKSIGAMVQQRFAGKPVWIGETGWPAAGRQRAGALPGPVEQARFVRELQKHGAGGALDYNIIEAFDQPWKRALEGAMGGYWGMFDQFGRLRVALRGAVIADPHWWRGPLCALLGALCATLLAALCLRSQSPPRQAPGRGLAKLLPLPLAGALVGAIAPAQWLAIQQWDRTPWEQFASVALGALGVALVGVTAWRQVHAGVEPAPAAHAAVLEGLGAFLRLAMLFCAASVALTLLFDARYRPFPWWWFAAPAAALATARALGAGWRAPRPQERLLALVIVVCSVGIAVAEGWRNAQALAFCALLLALAAAAGLRSRTNTSSASSAAGAQSCVL